MWRCLNDMWGYCSREPESEGEPKEVATGTYYGKCELNPETCGKFLKASEAIKPAEIQGEGYRHTVVAIAPEATSQTPQPTKSKKRLEQEERLL